MHTIHTHTHIYIQYIHTYILYYTILYYTILYYTILYYTILCHFNAVPVPEEVIERMVTLSNTILELNM
jgi:hypothetical protein